MTAVHYCTFGGADNRGYYLRRSYEFCQAWFDSFHISDTGATDETTQLTAELLGDPRVRYKKIPESYLQQPSWLEAIEQVIADIPDGDWFLFMDSDERPAPTLLHQLPKQTGSTFGGSSKANYHDGMASAWVFATGITSLIALRRCTRVLRFVIYRPRLSGGVGTRF